MSAPSTTNKEIKRPFSLSAAYGAGLAASGNGEYVNFATPEPSLRGVDYTARPRLRPTADEETIRTVLTAAETGHLVFSTLHTNSAAQTIDRILVDVPPTAQRQLRQQLAACLEGIVSMQLVPRAIGEGMVAAVEIVRRSPQISKLIADGAFEALDQEIESSVAYHKMQSMNQSLAALVIHGTITRDTAMGASTGPGDLDLLLRKIIGTNKEIKRPFSLSAAYGAGLAASGNGEYVNFATPEPSLRGVDYTARPRLRPTVAFRRVRGWSRRPPSRGDSHGLRFPPRRWRGVLRGVYSRPSRGPARISGPHRTGSS